MTFDSFFFFDDSSVTTLLCRLFLIGLICFFFVFVWEHVGRKCEIANRPSKYLWVIVRLCRAFWTNIGRIVAYVSSWINLIEFGELLVTCQELLFPVWEIIVSVTYASIGYLSVIKNYNWSQNKIMTGTVLIFFLVCCWFIGWAYPLLIVYFIVLVYIGICALVEYDKHQLRKQPVEDEKRITRSEL